VYFADERAVPRDDPASNYRLVRETLLNAAPIPTENVHPMMPLDFDPATLVGPEGGSALGEIARSCEKVLPDRFDVVVLGLGEDGHTASLFPGSPALQETERRVMPVEGPTEPRLRLTITPPVIAAARLLVVLVSGASKAPALRAALRDGSPGEVPGRLARAGIWLIGSDSLESSEGK
jgi:6-phosphogluconolactonase